MSPDLLTVGKLTVNCVIARDHPHPDRVRWRLDDVAAGPLLAALSTLLEPLARLHSDEVVIIKRLELSFDLDPSRDAPELARRWAARLAAALAVALAPQTRTSQLRFADEAHYLAQFLADTAAGRASGKWYYRRYRGWAALPVSAILRSAIADELGLGLAALRALGPEELGQVLAALGAREAQRIVLAIGEGDGDDFDGAAATVVHAADAFRARALASRSPWSVALALTAVAAELVAPSRLSSLARLAAAVAAWWIELEYAPANPAATKTAPATAAVAAAAAALDEAAPALMPLVALAPARRAQLQAALRPQAPMEPHGDVAVTAYTRFGGMLLLLRRLVDLPIDRVFSDERDRAMLRLIVVARCAGPARVREVLDDTLLQRLCGLGDGGTTAPETDDWITANAGRLANELAPALAASRLAIARSRRLAVARSPAVGALALGIAEPDGYWFALAPLSPSLRAELRGAALAPRPGDVLGLDDALGLAAVRDLCIATARAVSQVVCHLASSHRVAPIDAELALVLTAQNVLHGFARSLPGFAESSPMFLYDNFLAFSATVEETRERRACRIGRPPLATILSLTGAQRGRLTLPWLGGAGLELYPGG